MKKAFAGLAILVVLGGCSKIDKNVCWSEETKDLLHQKIAAQRDSTQKQVDDIQLRSAILRSPGMGLIDIAATDFNLDKIDQSAGAADCSFEFSVSVNFGNQKLRSEGRIPFAIRSGENGKALSLPNNSIQMIIANLRQVAE